MARYQQMKSGLKRQDFIFSDGWHDSKIKPPGTLSGQQFQVSDCENSDIFIFDNSACVYIDQCKGCYVFVGPCQGSIFLRNCENCILVGCCRQFRARDCKQCVFALWCQSQPVIETSSDALFDCFPNWGYPQLQGQIDSAGFSVWNNNWWDVWDFNKSKGGSNFTFKTLTDEQLKKDKFVKALDKCNLSFIDNIIPRTCGVIQPETCDILVYKLPLSAKVFWEVTGVLQTRYAAPSSHIMGQLQIQDGSYVFVKVRRSDAQRLQNCLDALKIKCLKRVHDPSRQIDEGIFVPFKDDR